MRHRTGARFGQQAQKRSLLFVASLAALGLSAGVSGCSQKPVASLNGTALSETDFAKQCETATDIQPNLGAVGQQVLMRWVQSTLQAQEAKKLNAYPSQKDVDAKLEGVRSQLAYGGTTLEQQLKAQGITLETYKRRLLEQMVQEAVMFSGIPIPEAEVVKAFEEGKSRFSKPATIRLSQITVETKAQLDQASNSLNSNADFGLVARTVSKDQFAQQGGQVPIDLPEAIQAGGPVQPAVVKAAFKLKEGEVSKPIQAGKSWVIVKVMKLTPRQEPKIEQVREIVRGSVIQTKMQSPEFQSKVQENQGKLFTALRGADFQIFRPEYAGLRDMVKNGGQSGPGAGGGPVAPGPAGPAGDEMPPPAPPGG